MTRATLSLTRYLCIPALLLGVLTASPSSASAQERFSAMGQELPVIGTPRQTRDWMAGMSAPQFMSELFIESAGGAYPPQYKCNIAVITPEGEVRASGQSPRPVEVEEGMSLAESCNAAYEIAAGLSGGELLPGDMLFKEDAMLPEAVPVTAEMMFAGEVDGFFVLDEIMTVASRSRDEYVAELGQRGLEGDVPGSVFLIMFTPAEEGQEFTSMARAVILPDTRPF